MTYEEFKEKYVRLEESLIDKHSVQNNIDLRKIIEEEIKELYLETLNKHLEPNNEH